MKNEEKSLKIMQIEKFDNQNDKTTVSEILSLCGLGTSYLMTIAMFVYGTIKPELADELISGIIWGIALTFTSTLAYLEASSKKLKFEKNELEEEKGETKKI